MSKLVDWFNRKVLRRHGWELWNGGTFRVRVDALPVDQFRYQREAAAARLRTIHPS